MYKQMAHNEGTSLSDYELLSPSPITPPDESSSLQSPLMLACSKKTLYYLRATLNASFGGDYDFRCGALVKSLLRCEVVR